MAYTDALFIINLRGPEILLRRAGGRQAKGRPLANLHLNRSEVDSIKSLVWTISPLSKGNSTTRLSRHTP